MRVKEIKEELDSRGVEWRGVMFEKETLQAALEAARAAPSAPPSAAPSPAPETDASTAASAEPAAEATAKPASAADTGSDSEAYTASYEAAYAESMKLKVKAIRTELARRQTQWADLFEKEELAARLAGLKARAAIFSVSGALTPGEATVVTAEVLRAEMQDARTPMLIDVYATWCGPCKLITPMLAKTAEGLGESVRVVKLDSDAEPELSTELRVNGLPTLVFMRDGQEVHRLEGVPPGQAALDALVKQHLGVGTE